MPVYIQFELVTALDFLGLTISNWTFQPVLSAFWISINIKCESYNPVSTVWHSNKTKWNEFIGADKHNEMHMQLVPLPAQVETKAEETKLSHWFTFILFNTEQQKICVTVEGG